MKIVLDTNILLVSFSSKSPLNWIWKSLLQNRFTLCATTDILLEYEEGHCKAYQPRNGKIGA